MTIAAQCEREVRDLHAFFQQWFRGELPATDAGFARLAGVMAPEFEIISPAGKILDRDGILAAVRERHGSDGGFTIEIRNHRHRAELADAALVTYEEWQGGKGRISTALLRTQPSMPNGVEWLHVHETWGSH